MCVAGPSRVLLLVPPLGQASGKHRNQHFHIVSMELPGCCGNQAARTANGLTPALTLSAVEQRVLNLCLLCDCTEAGGTCRYRRPRLLSDHHKCEWARFIFPECRNVYLFVDTDGKAKLSLDFLYRAVRTLLSASFCVFPVGKCC